MIQCFVKKEYEAPFGLDADAASVFGQPHR